MFTRSNLNKIKKSVINDCNNINPLILSILCKDSLLSGSFLLQSISQDFFINDTNYDIDIFCTQSEFEKNIGILYRNGYRKLEREQLKWIPFYDNEPNANPTHYCSFVKSVHDFVLYDGPILPKDPIWTHDVVKSDCGPIVQLIVCEKHPIETIRDFDFDLLENTFDGQNLEIKNYNGIQNKNITIQNKCKSRRIEKYKTRGFTFTNEPKNNSKILYQFNTEFCDVSEKRYFRN
jgi:hypothetical protein